MPGLVPPVADERQALLEFLEHARACVRTTSFGLTDTQAAEAATPSSLTVGGILKHLASVERFWMSVVRQEVRSGSNQEYQDSFALQPGETVAQVLADYRAAAAETATTVAAAADLGQPVPVPPGVPWFPQDVDAWSVRWVLLHLIQETARHAGHADIVREAVDGAAGFPLVAAAEDWPANDWITPWEPGA